MPDTDAGKTQLRFFPRQWPALALAAVCLVSALFLVYRQGQRVRADADPDVYATLGQNVDDVQLIDSGGEAVTWGALTGKPRLVFFGFTRCPEICPTTVAELSAALETLGPLARDVEVDFISVDPERDTPDLLARYFSSFGPQFRGFTGAKSEIDRLVAAYRVFYEYVPTQGDDYTVNHTAITYLVRADGAVAGIIGYGAPHDQTVAQLRAFLN